MLGLGSSPGGFPSIRTPPQSRKNGVGGAASGLSADLQNNFNTDFVMVTNSSPPRFSPPDVPLNTRRRKWLLLLVFFMVFLFN